MPKLTIILLLIIFLPFVVRGQGCSDAGFCSMGAMKPDQPFNRKVEFKLRSMELSFYGATTTTTARIFVTTADINFSINKNTAFQFKVPYYIASGNLGHTSGLSDLSLCLTRNIYSSEKIDIKASFGGKIPTNNSDKSNEKGNPFPMYYQTSLGTYDVIGGISLLSRKWLVATGIQHPFNENNNKFFNSNDWPDYPKPKYVNKHAPAYELHRGTDVMLRAERNFRFSRLNFSLGLLSIYRVNKDEIKNPTTGERFKLDKTTGMAMSAIFTSAYSFNVRSGIKLLVGRKLFNRKVNPDGLTREVVSSISYFYRF